VRELAARLRNDQPTPVSADKILSLLEVAAQTGDVGAQSALGLLLFEGKHTAADLSRALTWFTRAANRGDVFAQAWLGDVLATGQGVPKDPAASDAWYRLAADQGHVGALLAITAKAPEPGQDPEVDADLCAKWTKCAEIGDPLAQRMIGDFLVRGVRCPQDLPNGAKWLRKAAANGNVASKRILAKLLVNGQIPQEHPNEAMDMMHQAAAAGDGEASYSLGVCYSKGMAGLAADKKASLLWYRRAANQNHASAQVALGDLLLESAKSPEALSEARTWYSAAARAGNPKASLTLGQMHEAGLGVRRDLEAALGFYRQAADGGLEEAKDGIRRCSAVS